MAARKNRPGKFTGSHLDAVPVVAPSPRTVAQRPRVLLTTAATRLAYSTSTPA